MAEVHEVELGGMEGVGVAGGAVPVQSVPGDGTDALHADGDVAAGGAPVAPSFAFSAGQVQEAMLATDGVLGPQSAEVHENLMPMQRTLVYKYIGDYDVALASSLAAYVQVVCMCACMCACICGCMCAPVAMVVRWCANVCILCVVVEVAAAWSGL